MNLHPLSAAHIPLVAQWLQRKENYQWLDFGGGRQILSDAMLKIMTQRGDNHLRVFTSERADAPIGLVGLSNIALNFGTANLWYVLGDKSYGGQGYTTRAVSIQLRFGFDNLALASVSAWTCVDNMPSIRALEKNHFRLAGRLRHSHRVNELPVDRLLFDLLASEYQPVDDRDLASSEGALSKPG